MAPNIRKDDEVIVLSGKDKGKKGKVLKVLPDKNAVVVEKVAVAKRHMKKQMSRRVPMGGIVEKPMPLHISKVMLVCKRCHKPTITTIKRDGRGYPVRYCRSCEELIDAK